MKKTLFAMAALALCGTAFAKTMSTSGLEAAEGLDFYVPTGVITLNVDKTVEFGYFNTHEEASSLTLNFVGANTSFSAEMLIMPNLVSVMGDDAAKASWGESLTSSAGEVKTLTLASAAEEFIAPAPHSTTFEGLTESGSITLGNATVFYVGYYGVTTAADAEPLIAGDNQIVLVAIEDTKQLALVGKITPTAPEPATATLSLLALAGLASRRRRH